MSVGAFHSIEYDEKNDSIRLRYVNLAGDQTALVLKNVAMHQVHELREFFDGLLVVKREIERKKRIAGIEGKVFENIRGVTCGKYLVGKPLGDMVLVSSIEDMDADGEPWVVPVSVSDVLAGDIVKQVENDD